MTINLGVPDAPRLRPQIVVIGVGGAGGNAVNNMVRSHLEGVDFVCANTDAQALAQAQTERRIQLGASFTQGLGAGSRPDIGRGAAEEAMEDIVAHLEGNNMCFIAAGMGGGTGTGAAPVVARAARELDILTVGVVTKPFHFEGSQRMRIAEDGIRELQQYVDTLIVIPNQNLFRIANNKTTYADAFKMADNVLHAGVRGVTDLMVQPGLINLDFADVRTVMAEMGKAMMGTGEAEGERRAIEAAEAAISNPLLDDVSMKGARGVLINITGGYDITLFEIDEAANRIREEVDSEANIIFGATFDEALEGRMRISLVATGIEDQAAAQDAPFRSQTPRGQAMRPVLVKGGEAARSGAARAEAAPAGHVALSSTGVLESDGPPEPTDPGMVDDAPAVTAPAAMAEPLPAAPMPEPVVRPAAARVTETPIQAQPEPVVHRAVPAGPRDRFIPPRPVEPRRVPTLFERMTGTGRDRNETRAPEPPVQTRPVPAAEPLRPQQGDRIAVTSYEDVLDIPAFLRRQAN